MKVEVGMGYFWLLMRFLYLCFSVLVVVVRIVKDGHVS